MLGLLGLLDLLGLGVLGLGLSTLPVWASVAASSPLDGTAVYRWRTAPTALAELEGSADIWAYLPSTGELVVRLDAVQRATWEEAGRSLVLDVERTASLDRARQLLSAAAATPAGAKSGARATITGFPCYRTVDETYAVLAAAAEARPSLARWLDIGDSWRKEAGQEDGHDHHVLVLTNFDKPGPKPPLLIMAAMHPRELTTAEVATRFALELLAGYGVDADATWLLDEREIHVVPHQNPDGRVEAEKGFLWRKNTNNDFCGDTADRGVDLNRNSAWFHGGALSGFGPCDEFFKGPEALSEPETRTIHDYMDSIFVDRKGDMGAAAPPDTEGVLISLHSFGEVILYPWQGVSDISPNLVGLRALGRRFGALTGGYAVCQTCIGKAGGTTTDAAHGDYGIAAFTFEIGTDFLEPCQRFESFVDPVMGPPLLYAAKVAAAPYEMSHGPVVLRVEPGATVNGLLDVQAELTDDLFESGGFGDEPVHNLVEARVWLGSEADAVDGIPMTPVDGQADSPQESFVGAVSVSGLAPGRHLVFVQGRDASGYWGAPTAAFFTLEADMSEVFRDGFELGSTAAWSLVEP